MSNEESIEEVKKLLLEDEVKEAHSLLSSLTSDNELNKKILIQLSKVNEIETKGSLGIIPSEEYKLEKNKIKWYLLELLDELIQEKSKDNNNRSEVKSDPPKSGLFRLRYATIFFSCISVIILSITGIYVFWRKDRSPNTSKLYAIQQSLDIINSTSASENSKAKEIEFLLKELPYNTQIILKGANGSLIDLFELESFLRELNYGVHEYIQIEKIEGNSVIIRYLE